jgi:hypothetical protein
MVLRPVTGGPENGHPQGQNPEPYFGSGPVISALRDVKLARPGPKQKARIWVKPAKRPNSLVRQASRCSDEQTTSTEAI